MRNTLASLFLFMSMSSLAMADLPPWHAALGTEDSINTVQSIDTMAEVTVSDGQSYRVFTSWQDPERIMMHREQAGTSTTMAVEGFDAWVHNGEKFQLLGNSHKDFIRGHQYHAMLLKFDEFAPVELTRSFDAECACTLISGQDKSGNEFEVQLDNLDRPYRLTNRYAEFGEIVSSFEDWQSSGGLNLPRKIMIDDGERVFTYRYHDITMNDAVDYRQYLPPLDILPDQHALYRLHRDMIDAHLLSDESVMHHIWASEITMVNRGKIARVPGQAAASKMQSSLSGRTHTRYVDLEKPVITISEDGTLGWLAARVEAEGFVNGESKPGQPFRFVSAWVALFEKQAGTWVMTGNVSNFET